MAQEVRQARQKKTRVQEGLLLRDGPLGEEPQVSYEGAGQQVELTIQESPNTPPRKVTGTISASLKTSTFRMLLLSTAAGTLYMVRSTLGPSIADPVSQLPLHAPWLIGIQFTTLGSAIKWLLKSHKGWHRKNPYAADLLDRTTLFVADTAHSAAFISVLIWLTAISPLVKIGEISFWLRDLQLHYYAVLSFLLTTFNTPSTIVRTLYERGQEIILETPIRILIPIQPDAEQEEETEDRQATEAR